MLAIGGEAATIRQRRAIAGSWTSVDVTVPATGLSFHTAVRFMRQMFGLTEVRIAGELITLADNTWLLHVRSAGRRIADATVASVSDIDGHFGPIAERLWLEIDPFTLAAHHWQRSPDAAINILRHCLTRPPTDDDAWAFNLWGNVLLQRGQYDLASVKFRQATELAPSWWVPHHNWGKALVESGKVTAGVGHLRLAVAMGGHSSARVLTDLGTAYAVQQKRRAAIEVLERAVSIDRGFAPAATQLVRVHLAGGAIRRATDLCRRGADLFIKEANVLEACGDAHAAAADYHMAASYYERVASLAWATAEFCFKWAVVLERDGRVTDAIIQYENVLRKDATHGEAGVALARLTEKDRNQLHLAGQNKTIARD
jgi:tetratricopeptide (TPR) repeat protein